MSQIMKSRRNLNCISCFQLEMTVKIMGLCLDKTMGFCRTLKQASELVWILAIVSLVWYDKIARDFHRSLWGSFVWADFDFSLNNQS